MNQKPFDCVSAAKFSVFYDRGSGHHRKLFMRSHSQGYPAYFWHACRCQYMCVCVCVCVCVIKVHGLMPDVFLNVFKDIQKKKKKTQSNGTLC